MIIDALKSKIFPFGVEEPEDLGKNPDENNESDESDEFYTLRETISKLSNFENEEEAPRDIPNLESAAQRTKTKGQGLKILTPQQIQMVVNYQFL